MRRWNRAARAASLSGALGASLLGSLAVAQQSPPAGDAVTLAFKFVPGKVSRQQVKLNADMKLGLGGEGEQPGQPGQAAPAAQEIPLQMGVTMLLTQKVDAVSPEGEGTLSVAVDGMDMLMSFFGQNFLVKGTKGKVTASLNGQAMPVEGSPAGQLGLDQMLGKSFTLKIGRTGQMGAVGGLAQSPLSQVPGMSNAQQVFGGGVTLPDHPVKPGESWERKTTLPMPMPVQGGKMLTMELDTVNTLKSVTTKGGHQIALIEMKGNSVLTGEGAPDRSKFSQSFTGTTEFDVTAGEPKTTKMDMDVTLDMASLLGSGGGGEGAAAALAAASVKGRISITAGPAPAAAPAKKPPVKKPPVRKAPVRR